MVVPFSSLFQAVEPKLAAVVPKRFLLDCSCADRNIFNLSHIHTLTHTHTAFAAASYIG